MSKKSRHYEKVAASLKKRWKSKKFRAKMAKAQTKGKKKKSETFKKLWKTEEYRNKSIAERKQRWSDPEYKKRVGEAISVALSNPEVKKRRRVSLKKYWEENPKRKLTKDEKKAVSKTHKSLWADPEYRARMLKIRKKQGANKAGRSLNRIRTTKLWQDPEYRARQTKDRNDRFKGASGEVLKAKLRKARAKQTEAGMWNKGLTKYDHPGIMKASKKLMGRPPRPVNKFPYKKWVMRSTWEVVFAMICDKAWVEFQYESWWFYIGKSEEYIGHTYLPDFYLPKVNMYVEIKGWNRNKDKSKENKQWIAKEKRFRKKYPYIHLLVLSMSGIRHMAKIYGVTLPIDKIIHSLQKKNKLRKERNRPKDLNV